MYFNWYNQLVLKILDTQGLGRSNIEAVDSNLAQGMNISPGPLYVVS
jgi:hypothetical protein